MRLARLSIAVALLVVGCATGNRSTAVDRKQLHAGDTVHGYRLVGVDGEGRAQFWDLDHDSMGPAVSPGQSFGLDVESPRGHFTQYHFTVEKTDASSQSVTIRGETTQSSRPASGPAPKRP